MSVAKVRCDLTENVDVDVETWSEKQFDMVGESQQDTMAIWWRLYR